MKTHKFVRKPFYVDAVRVSEENMEEVATWSGGEIKTGTEGKHIKVKVYRPLNDRQAEAYVGDWVLSAGTGFKVYTPKAFDRAFEKVKTLTKDQADAAGIKVPHEPREKRKPQPPSNPVMSLEKAQELLARQEASREAEAAATPVNISRKIDREVAVTPATDDEVQQYIDKALTPDT